MKRKKQNPIKNPALKPKVKLNKTSQAKPPCVPTPILQVDCIVADIALVNRDEASKVAKPTVCIYKDKASDVIVDLSMQPPARPDLAGIVEKIFSQAQSGMKWIDGRE